MSDDTIMKAGDFFRSCAEGTYILLQKNGELLDLLCATPDHDELVDYVGERLPIELPMPELRRDE